MSRQLYFAYGSNMDVGQLIQRCPAATLGRVSELPGHRLLINSRGVATVVADPSRVVMGLLWLLTAPDVVALDRSEGVAKGLYRKAYYLVDSGAGTSEALVYVATDSVPGKPRPGYLEKILAAAALIELPLTYIAELRQLA